MSTLAKLKLVNSKRTNSINPLIHRRNKLATKLNEQIDAATAHKQGVLYAPKKLKSVADKDTGERRIIETTKRGKQWFWINELGKINLTVRYGSKVIELAKGKNAVEVASDDELIATLTLIRDAVLAGDLDEAITQASNKLRSGFEK